MKIAMLVFNNCTADHRVVKQAEHLAKLGNDVCIFCLFGQDIPDQEEKNGVQYRRFKIDWRKTLLKFRWLRFNPRE